MVSIVMVVKDRLRLTQQSILSLMDHTDRNDYTLTLVDDASTDFRVRRVLEAACRWPNTTCIRIEKSAGVVARAKNIGVMWSEQTFGRGNYLYLSDNDVYFKEGWLDTLTAIAFHTKVDGYALWGAQIHPFHEPERPHCKLSDCKVDEYSVLDGPSWLMQWSIWDSIGPLNRDTAPGTCQSEEYPFCKRLKNAGYKIGVLREHIVLHTGLTNTKGEKTPGYEQRKALMDMEGGIIYE